MSPYLPVAHDQDAVAVEDGGDTVCDDQHCAAPETFTDCVLDEDVRLQVAEDAPGRAGTYLGRPRFEAGFLINQSSPCHS